MCGLTGFYDFNGQRRRSEQRKIVQSMNDTLFKRGPDQGDVWQEASAALNFGHRRLSIQDLSETGAQPMTSHSERFVIAYNGEIYNVTPLRHELEVTGVKFRGHSDTEVFLAGCERWGVNQTLQKINGMFAIALWDKKEQHLHLIRDRLGKKPLYVGWAGQTLVFGSELKALRKHPDYQTHVNQNAAALFFRYGSIPAPHTIDLNTWHIPAGQRIVLDLSGKNDIETGSDLTALMVPYWSAVNRVRDTRKVLRDGDDEQTILHDFESLLKQCVGDRMISDVPLGAFLSGGIDSSLVVALMQDQQTQPVKTFSIGFDEAGFDEAVYAREVAEYLGTDHHEMYVSSAQARDVIPHLPDMYDEPFADISAIPTTLVSQYARQSVTVALSGDGGDEMMGGYNRHVNAPNIWRKIKTMPLGARRILASAMVGVSVDAWNIILPFRPQAGVAVHKMASILQQQNPEGVYTTLCSHWKDSPLITSCGDDALSLPKVDGLSFAEDMMLWDVLSYLPQTILTKVDRASMAHSLEARAPLLDTRLFDFAWQLPQHYKIRDGKGKWLLRQVLGKYVPQHLFERPKQGFSMPVGHWMKTDLRDWAEDLLSTQALEQTGLLNAGLIRKKWDAHLKGYGQNETQIWCVLMFQAWAKRWL